MIHPSQIGDDEDLAREVLLAATDFAPCLNTIPSIGDDMDNALAVLRNLYKSCVLRGALDVKRQSQGPSSVEYFDVTSVFSARQRAALRALCGSASSGGHSVGNFPTDRPLGRVWPEAYS